MKYKPSPFMRVTFLVVGCAFFAAGPVFGSWLLMPFGLLSLFVGGMETLVRPNAEKNELVVESFTWGVNYLTRRFDIDPDSLLVVVHYPAGSDTGDGRSLSDSGLVFLESSRGRRHRIAASSDIKSLSQSAGELASALRIKLKKEEMVA